MFLGLQDSIVSFVQKNLELLIIIISGLGLACISIIYALYGGS